MVIVADWPDVDPAERDRHRAEGVVVVEPAPAAPGCPNEISSGGPA